MANKRIQRLKGTTAAIASMTPLLSEYITNLDNFRIHVGDGSTLGGHPLALLSDLTAGLNTKANSSHTHTPAQVGLSNVANKSEAQMVASGAIADALEGKLPSNAQAADSAMLGNMSVLEWQNFVNSKASGFEVESIGYNGGQGLPFIKKKGAEEYRDLATRQYVDQRAWPGVSRSDNQHETNFPVGHPVFCGSFQAVSNQTFDCRTSGGNYTNGTGSRLAGTWKTRGSGTNGTLAQRVG